MKSTKKTKKAPVKKTSATTKKSVNTQKNPVTKKKNKTRNVKENISKKVPIGRTLQTRDEFLASGKGKKNIKPDHPSKRDLYRRVGVVDSNANDELAVIKLGTKGRHALKKYLNGKSSYNAFIEIEDNKNKPIKIDGIKFVENKPNRDISKQDIDEMLNNALHNNKTSKKLRYTNKQNIKKLKTRK